MLFEIFRDLPTQIIWFSRLSHSSRRRITLTSRTRSFFGSFEVSNQLNCLSTPEKPAHALPFPFSFFLFSFTHICLPLPSLFVVNIISLYSFIFLHRKILYCRCFHSIILHLMRQERQVLYIFIVEYNLHRAKLRKL